MSSDLNTDGKSGHVEMISLLFAYEMNMAHPVFTTDADHS